MASGMHGGEGVHEGACVVGACIVRVRVVGECMGMYGRGGMHSRGACMVGETATAAGGTHPTGMHSCLL